MQKLTRKDEISSLRKLLKLMQNLVELCDQLDPYKGSVRQMTFFEVCIYGAMAIGRLWDIDNSIICNSNRLNALSQPELHKLLGLRPPRSDKDGRRQWVGEVWGKALEFTDGLKDATQFCSCLTREKKWPRDKNYRTKFKECSQKLAYDLLYEVLDILTKYDAGRYPNLRLQVVCSYLRDFRVDFILNALVTGPCRSDRISDEFRPKNLPANLEGYALVVFGNRRHEFTFSTSTGKFERLINNTGLENYRAMLNEIWDVSTGQLRYYPGGDKAVWRVLRRKHIKFLNEDADNICELLKPLLAAKEYRKYADKVRAIIRYEGRPWTTLDVSWPYLDNLEKIITDLDTAIDINKDGLTQKNPAEKEQNAEVRIEVMRDQVFICYSHKDKRWLEDLETHLKPYVRNSSVTAWSDKQIAPGSKWMKEIEAALSATKVAVLLVTPNFLASDFIHESELGPLLKNAEKGKVTIIWVPVRACSYKETPLKDYQAAIDPEKPLANMKAERDKSWVKICEEIKKAVR